MREERRAAEVDGCRAKVDTGAKFEGGEGVGRWARRFLNRLLAIAESDFRWGRAHVFGDELCLRLPDELPVAAHHGHDVGIVPAPRARGTAERATARQRSDGFSNMGACESIEPICLSAGTNDGLGSIHERGSRRRDRAALCQTEGRART